MYLKLQKTVWANHIARFKLSVQKVADTHKNYWIGGILDSGKWKMFVYIWRLACGVLFPKVECCWLLLVVVCCRWCLLSLLVVVCCRCCFFLLFLFLLVSFPFFISSSTCYAFCNNFLCFTSNATKHTMKTNLLVKQHSLEFHWTSWILIR